MLLSKSFRLIHLNAIFGVNQILYDKIHLKHSNIDPTSLFLMNENKIK